MADLPFTGRAYRYRGSDLRKQQKTAEKNRFVRQAAEYANRLAANNPAELQQILFATIAAKIGCDVEIVRHAISDGGYNGITFRVTEADREMLRPYLAST